MKKLAVILLLLPTLTFAQTGDAGSGWANWLVNTARAAEEKIRGAKMIEETIRLVNLYKDTKQLTGIVAASTKDLKEFTKKFQDDLTNIDDISKSQIEDLKAYFSWKDALEGNGYPSIAGLTDWYEAETAGIRDRKGNITAAALLFNTVSVEDQFAAIRSMDMTLVQLNRQRDIHVNNEISDMLRRAQQIQRDARKRLTRLNVRVLGNSVGNLGNNSNQEARKIQEQFVQDEIDAIRKLEAEVATLRSEAMNKMRDLIRADYAVARDLLGLRQLQQMNEPIPFEATQGLKLFDGDYEAAGPEIFYRRSGWDSAYDD